MRLWSPELFPYLPELQFKGQYRELVAIMHDWRDKNTTNNLLINHVMNYPKDELVKYFIEYDNAYYQRFHKTLSDHTWHEFMAFGEHDLSDKNFDTHNIYHGWLDSPEYYKVELYNLYEKHAFGVGKSRITDYQWSKLVEGFRKLKVL